MLFLQREETQWLWPGFTVPSLVATNLPENKQYSLAMIKPVSGAIIATSYIEGGVASITTDQVFNRELNFIAFEQEGDTNLYMALNTTLTDAAPLLEFQSATGGDIGGGDGGTETQARIAGTVTIDGTPAARDVVVISDNAGSRQVVGEGSSDATGAFDIEYTGWPGHVVALAIDEYGRDWEPEVALNQGTVVHPSTPNGYTYEVTSVGTTGTTEPTWATSGSVNDGSVTYQARPFYRPIASGPLQGEVLQEPDPEP